MDWLSPPQLLLLAVAVPLLVAGLGAWLLDPSPRPPRRTNALGQKGPDRPRRSHSARQPAARPSSPHSPSPDQVPPSGA
jgi:hypothetical protein